MATGASGEMHAHHDRSYSSYPCFDRWRSYSGNAEAAEPGGRDLSDLRRGDWTRSTEIASHLALARSVRDARLYSVACLMGLVARAKLRYLLRHPPIDPSCHQSRYSNKKGRHNQTILDFTESHQGLPFLCVTARPPGREPMK